MNHPLFKAHELPETTRMRGIDGNIYVVRDMTWVITEVAKYHLIRINDKQVLKEMLPFKETCNDEYIIPCERIDDDVVEDEVVEYTTRGRGRPRKIKHYTRAPTAYNEFIRETLKMLAIKNPKQDGKQRMRDAAKLWKNLQNNS